MAPKWMKFIFRSDFEREHLLCWRETIEKISLLPCAKWKEINYSSQKPLAGFQHKCKWNPFAWNRSKSKQVSEGAGIEHGKATEYPRMTKSYLPVSVNRKCALSSYCHNQPISIPKWLTSEASSSVIYRKIKSEYERPDPARPIPCWRVWEDYIFMTENPIFIRFSRGNWSIQATLITVGFGSLGGGHSGW